MSKFQITVYQGETGIEFSNMEQSDVDKIMYSIAHCAPIITLSDTDKETCIFNVANIDSVSVVEVD